MDEQTIIQRARAHFDEDFAKKNYMESRTGDIEHLNRILGCLIILPGSKVLDLGTGSGFLAFPIAQANAECSLAGLDIAIRTLANNREKAALMGLSNLNFVDYDGMDFPFEDHLFDYVVSRYALHHFPVIDKTFSEVSRVLKKGGCFFLSDPTPNSLDNVGFVDSFMQLKNDGHVKFYSMSEFIDLATNHGFRLIHSFESRIRFSRELTEPYLTLTAGIDIRILDSYDLKMIDDLIYITEEVNNLLFQKL